MEKLEWEIDLKKNHPNLSEICEDSKVVDFQIGKSYVITFTGNYFPADFQIDGKSRKSVTSVEIVPKLKQIKFEGNNPRRLIFEDNYVYELNSGTIFYNTQLENYNPRKRVIRISLKEDKNPF